MRELERAIEQELDESGPIQLPLDFSGWTGSGAAAVNPRHGRAAPPLEAIPAEIEAEKERIYNRVLSPTLAPCPHRLLFS